MQPRYETKNAQLPEETKVGMLRSKNISPDQTTKQRASGLVAA